MLHQRAHPLSRLLLSSKLDKCRPLACTQMPKDGLDHGTLIDETLSIVHLILAAHYRQGEVRDLARTAELKTRLY